MFEPVKVECIFAICKLKSMFRVCTYVVPERLWCSPLDWKLASNLSRVKIYSVCQTKVWYLKQSQTHIVYTRSIYHRHRGVVCWHCIVLNIISWLPKNTSFMYAKTPLKHKQVLWSQINFYLKKSPIETLDCLV